MAGWLVIENTPGYMPETLPIELDRFEDAQMVAEATALAFATLFGDPNANPVLVRESPSRWRVTTDYPHAFDHVIEVVQSEDGHVS